MFPAVHRRLKVSVRNQMTILASKEVSMCIAPCPKCEKRTRVTKHHVLPQRFYGSPANAPILLICRICHSELEKLIPENPKMTYLFYWIIIFEFLQKDTVRIVEWAGYH